MGFTAPFSLAIALAMVLLIFAVAVVRKIAVGWLAGGLFAAGAILLCMAAGSPMWNRSGKPSILVMVDLSPSTRGATFRDRSALEIRLHQLLGDRPYQMLAFADGNQPMPGGTNLPDIPADQTRFSPPTADAIVLLSDGQFELPAFAPPTYPLIDLALDRPADAAVVDLKAVDHQVLAELRENGQPRPLKWTGATPDHFTQLATPTGTGEITASLPPGDLWPENDSLALAPQPPLEKTKWWIGVGDPAGWTVLAPGALPGDSAAFLAPSVVVLNDIAADSFSSDQQARLLQYVRDLGGSVVMIGGPHAFAAGHYENTPLDVLSPLASSPPEPALQWLLLIDSSGSMAGDPWKTEVTAITRLLPQLPAADSVNIGSFAEGLSWWSTGKSASQTAKLTLPPINAIPNGPTNLAATLDELAGKSDGAMPSELLLVTDADAALAHPTELAAAMNAKKIHLHLLAIGRGKALAALGSIATATGGSVIEQLDPEQWIAGANLLLRSALPDHYQHRTIELTPAPPASISEWNQTWLKESATQLQGSNSIPTIARWQLGLGQVIAIAYAADAQNVEKFASQIQQPPNDPRFAVTWNASSTLRVKVDAVDHDRYLNGLTITVDMVDPRVEQVKPVAVKMPQVAPGEYELKIPAPRSSQLVCVRHGNAVLKRFSIAGRYAPEFDAIGNNLVNLKTLAERTGGEVIPPGPVNRIDFARPKIRVSIAPELAFSGFVMLAMGLIRHRQQA